MAEAHINTLFGAYGFLGQLVQNTFKAFELWDKVERAAESADEYITRLQFLRARLHWWTICWGILDDEIFPACQRTQFELYKDAIANYLRLITHTLQDLASYENNTSIFKSTQNAINSTGLGRLVSLLNPLLFSPYTTSNEPLSDETSTLRERLKWALASGKAMAHLKMLSDLIHDLESFLPPPEFELNGKVLVNPALAGNIWKLRWLSRQNDFDIFTVSLAQLKATSLSLIDDIKVSAVQNSSRINGVLEYLGTTEAKYTSLGRYNGVSVVVDRKKVPITTNHTLLRARIEKVIRLLNASRNITELRIPPCLGWAYTQTREDESSQPFEYCAYDIVYAFDGLHIISLQHMLHNSIKLPLHKRFDVAKSLARSLLYLHTAEWLHKGIRSSNVIFSSIRSLTKSENPTQRSDRKFLAEIGLPYLVGFEYSRVNSHDEKTEHITDDSENNLYRHPDVQGQPSTGPDSYLGDSPRFSKNHDIYSLGVVLLELGLYQPASVINAKFPRFQETYDDGLFYRVEFQMGAIYAKVISICFKGEIYLSGVANDQQGAVKFYRDVVSRLEKCTA
ncbi:hypothetical protein VI817_009399 [Penicillium citrinum]|nr:hypothetical protein VI817_009399 [Penicillium citrinum]